MRRSEWDDDGMFFVIDWQRCCTLEVKDTEGPIGFLYDYFKGGKLSGSSTTSKRTASLKRQRKSTASARSISTRKKNTNGGRKR